MSDQFPVGSLWQLPDGRRVRVVTNPYWMPDHVVSLFVENRRRGGRRYTEFRASSFAKIATPAGELHKVQP